MDLISKQAALVNDPEFFSNVCDFIVGGGTLAEYCRVHDISYPAALKWVRQDVNRRNLYERAENDRDQWMKDQTIRELRDLASFDLASIMDENGNQKPFKDWPSSVQRSVVSIKKAADGSTEIKFSDKLKALDMTGKSIGLFKEKVEHSGKLTLETLVGQSMAPKKDK